MGGGGVRKRGKVEGGSEGVGGAVENEHYFLIMRARLLYSWSLIELRRV